MQTSVNLQEPFSYSILPIILFIILILIIIIPTLYKKFRKVAIIEIKETPPEDKKSIQKKYLKRLAKLQKKVNENAISSRLAYQELSCIIRYFVYEVTKIKVQNCTLRDIKQLDIPPLYELIKEYYTPEFAKRYLGNINSSIQKTREVIEKWN